MDWFMICAGSSPCNALYGQDGKGSHSRLKFVSKSQTSCLTTPGHTNKLYIYFTFAMGNHAWTAWVVLWIKRISFFHLRLHDLFSLTVKSAWHASTVLTQPTSCFHLFHVDHDGGNWPPAHIMDNINCLAHSLVNISIATYIAPSDCRHVWCVFFWLHPAKKCFPTRKH